MAVVQSIVPVVSAEPVQRYVKLDDVSGEENVVSGFQRVLIHDHVDAEQAASEHPAADDDVLYGVQDVQGYAALEFFFLKKGQN